MFTLRKSIKLHTYDIFTLLYISLGYGEQTLFKFLFPDSIRPVRQEEYWMRENYPFLSWTNTSCEHSREQGRPGPCALHLHGQAVDRPLLGTCCHVCYSEKQLPTCWGQGTCLFTYLEHSLHGTHKTEYSKHNMQALNVSWLLGWKINLRTSFRLSVISAGQINLRTTNSTYTVQW